MIALDSGQLDGLGKGEDPAKLQLQAADGRRAGRDRFLKESKQPSKHHQLEFLEAKWCTTQ